MQKKYVTNDYAITFVMYILAIWYRYHHPVYVPER